MCVVVDDVLDDVVDGDVRVVIDGCHLILFALHAVRVECVNEADNVAIARNCH